METKAIVVGIILVSNLCSFGQNRARGNESAILGIDKKVEKIGIHRHEGRVSRGFWKSTEKGKRVRGARGINFLQSQTQEKINQGSRSGLLTKKETAKLVRKFEKIGEKEQLFARNGRISRREGKELKRDINHLDRRINKEVRDRNRARERRRF